MPTHMAWSYCMQKNINPDNNTDMDQANALVMAVATYLDNVALTAYPNIIWTDTQISTLADPDHMRRLRCFTSVIVVSFRAMEDR